MLPVAAKLKVGRGPEMHSTDCYKLNIVSLRSSIIVVGHGNQHWKIFFWLTWKQLHHNWLKLHFQVFSHIKWKWTFHFQVFSSIFHSKTEFNKTSSILHKYRQCPKDPSYLDSRVRCKFFRLPHHFGGGTSCHLAFKREVSSLSGLQLWCVNGHLRQTWDQHRKQDEHGLALSW